MASTIDNPFEEDEFSHESMFYGDIELTVDQQRFVDKNWDSMDLMDMVRHIYGDPNLDGRSKQGRLVRKYMSKRHYDYTTTKTEKKGEVVLTEDQKELILQNAAAITKVTDLTDIAFNTSGSHNFSKEVKAVQKFLAESNPKLFSNLHEYTEETYTPPKTFAKAFKKINEFAHAELVEKELNLREKKCVEALASYMNSNRFVAIMNNLTNVHERALFESQFVAQTWDKSDLTVEELNLYMNLCNEYVIQFRINKIISHLNRMLEDIVEDDNGKISMAFSDAIKGKSDEYHQSVNRQASITKDLTGRRSDRVKLRIQQNRSVVALVEALQSEKERKSMLDMAERRKQANKKELDVMENMEEWTVRIFGVDGEEVLK